MYDSVRMVLFSDCALSCVENLKSVWRSKNENDTTIISGYLPSPSTAKGCDLKVRVFERTGKIVIGETSFCKWYYGNNLIDHLTIEDTKRCMGLIGEGLNIPIDDAYITRLDIGYNIEVDHPSELYIPYLGELMRYERGQYQKNAVYYTNRTKQFTVYDKIKEQRSRRQPIPDELKDKNILRLELRIKRELPKLFKRTIRARDLYDESFYLECLNLWRMTYLNIEKINDSVLDFKSIRTVSMLRRYGLSCVIEKHGYLELLRQIKEHQQIKLITRKQASDLRRDLKAAVESKDFTIKAPLINEFDEKMNSF